MFVTIYYGMELNQSTFIDREGIEHVLQWDANNKKHYYYKTYTHQVTNKNGSSSARTGRVKIYTGSCVRPTPEQTEDVRTLHAFGVKPAAICRITGLSRHFVSKIISE